VTTGGTQRPSSASVLGAYNRIVTPSVPFFGDGNQLDILSFAGD